MFPSSAPLPLSLQLLLQLPELPRQYLLKTLLKQAVLELLLSLPALLPSAVQCHSVSRSVMETVPPNLPELAQLSTGKLKANSKNELL